MSTPYDPESTDTPLCWVRKRPMLCTIARCAKRAEYEVTNSQEEITGPLCLAHAKELVALTIELEIYQRSQHDPSL